MFTAKISQFHKILNDLIYVYEQYAHENERRIDEVVSLFLSFTSLQLHVLRGIEKHKVYTT